MKLIVCIGEGPMKQSIFELYSIRQTKYGHNIAPNVTWRKKGVTVLLFDRLYLNSKNAYLKLL